MTFRDDNAQDRPDALASPAEPSHADIARRAYTIYVRKGCRPGHCEQNWRQAEGELRAQTSS
jgi:hypothetical protein